MSADVVAPAPRHPAKWTEAVLDEIAAALAAAGLWRDTDVPRILDPFAGVGRGRLAADLPGMADVVGVELEPRWAAADPATIVGDATALSFPDGSFEAVVTSPTYGNRMADDHDARDACKHCAGAGRIHVDADGNVPCPVCKGEGLSRRNTYRHALGEPLAPGSTAGMQWGPAYRATHEQAWREARRVVAPGGLVVVNAKNHIRAGRVVPVSEWHLVTLIRLGLEHVETRRVPVRGNRQGANGDARVDAEHVHVMRKANQ